MTKLWEFALKNTSMFWDIPKTALENASELTVLERVYCYGNWEQYKDVEKLVWKNRAREIFIERAYMPRTNLREETINLFTHYFHVTPPSDRTLSRAI